MLKPAALFLIPCLLAGCYVESHDDASWEGNAGGAPSPTYAAEQSTIDPKAWMDSIVPGQDLGVYVEYAGAGQWHVFATCDTASSGQRCHWEVYADRLGSAVTGATPENLESNDMFGWNSEGAWMDTDTATDADGFYFYGAPGAAYRFDIYLDGEPANRWFYWVGDDAVHSGAPTNPMDLKPNPE